MGELFRQCRFAFLAFSYPYEFEETFSDHICPVEVSDSGCTESGFKIIKYTDTDTDVSEYLAENLVHFVVDLHVPRLIDDSGCASVFLGLHNRSAVIVD